MAKKQIKVTEHLRQGRRVRKHVRAKTYYVIVDKTGEIVLKPFRFDQEIAFAFICGSGGEDYDGVFVDKSWLEDGPDSPMVFAINPYPDESWTCVDDVALKGFTEEQVEDFKQLGAFKFVSTM